MRSTAKHSVKCAPTVSINFYHYSQALSKARKWSVYIRARGGVTTAITWRGVISAWVWAAIKPLSAGANPLQSSTKALRYVRSCGLPTTDIG